MHLQADLRYHAVLLFSSPLEYEPCHHLAVALAFFRRVLEYLVLRALQRDVDLSSTS